MKTLSKAQFANALDYISRCARPLERATASMRYEAGDKQAVLDALRAFQNGDGGFGHGLEPDVRTPSSSALATALALRVLQETGTPSRHPMVDSAIQYLVRTVDRVNARWAVLPPDANDHPHAPWWHDDGESLARTFDNFQVIPRALLVSFLHTYRDLVPADLLKSVTDQTMNTLLTVPVLGEGGGSDLEYAIELAENPAFPEELRAQLIARIELAIPNVIVRDPTRWSSYCLQPIHAVRRPDSIGASSVIDDVHRNLDYLIASQDPDGSWPLTWNWGASYPEIWPQAENEWRGVVALEYLKILGAFGRLERF